MKNIKLLIGYDGTDYYGWQIQPDKITIQGTIKEKLQIILQEQITLIGASRTDAGVHAREQVANFLTKNPLTALEIKKRLNKLLPSDIRILDCKEVDKSFNARKHAKYKTYKYYIYHAEISSPFYRNYSWFLSEAISLNLNLLNEVSEDIVGKKNFISFSGQKTDVKTFERTVYKAFWGKKDNFYIFTITGKGFLKNMVRKIVGSIVAIASEKEKKYFLNYLLAIKDRKEGKYSAPPQGLFLDKIFY